MSYKKMALELIRELSYVEKEYKKLKKHIEEFCATTGEFTSKQLFQVAKNIADGKFTYNEFVKEFDKQLIELKKQRKN